jgi:hypothetical protein
MWTPSYYEAWHRRVTEINALASLEDKLRYARQSGLNYVVSTCAANGGERQAVFQTKLLCVYPASSPARTAKAS